MVAVVLANAWGAPPLLSTHIVTIARVGAATLAMVLTLAVMTLLRATHPSAATTTLLVAPGTFRTAYDAVTVIIGVLILAVIGEAARQLRVRATENPSPTVH